MYSAKANDSLRRQFWLPPGLRGAQHIAITDENPHATHGVAIVPKPGGKSFAPEPSGNILSGQHHADDIGTRDIPARDQLDRLVQRNILSKPADLLEELQAAFAPLVEFLRSGAVLIGQFLLAAGFQFRQEDAVPGLVVLLCEKVVFPQGVALAPASSVSLLAASSKTFSRSAMSCRLVAALRLTKASICQTIKPMPASAGSEPEARIAWKTARRSSSLDSVPRRVQSPYHGGGSGEASAIIASVA